MNLSLLSQRITTWFAFFVGFSICLLLLSGCAVLVQSEPVRSATVECISPPSLSLGNDFPAFVHGVAPAAGSIVCQHDFQRTINAIGETLIGFGDLEHGFSSEICMHLSFESLVEANDDFISEPPANHMKLIVNQVVIKNEPLVISGILFGRSEMLNANYPAGEESYCWPVSLSAGEQQVEFTFLKTSGAKATYEWVFEIK